MTIIYSGLNIRLQRYNACYRKQKHLVLSLRITYAINIWSRARTYVEAQWTG